MSGHLIVMKSIIIHSAYDLRIQNYPLEKFGENEIEITTSVGGVCGTDLHYYQDGGFGAIKLKERPGFPIHLSSPAQRRSFRT